MQVDVPSWERGRSKKMWTEVVKLYLKKCNLSKNLIKDSSEWRNEIHVASPNNDFDNDDNDISLPMHTQCGKLILLNQFDI